MIKVTVIKTLSPLSRTRMCPSHYLHILPGNINLIISVSRNGLVLGSVIGHLFNITLIYSYLDGCDR